MAGVAPLEWLLDSDPAIRWQAERDLLHAPEEVWQATRARIATEGFGARVLALRDRDGVWAGGSYFPRDHGGTKVAGVRAPWTATTWSLNALREWGLDAAALGGAAEKLAAQRRWEHDDLPYWAGDAGCCVKACTLANGAWLGVDVSGLAEWFVEHSLHDGGWNCDWVGGTVRSSFHSTLNGVKALLWYERDTGDTLRAQEARRGGEEYLLERNLCRRLSTGDSVEPWATRLAYPFRWSYNVLDALDHFREVSALDGTPPDPRLATAVEIVRAKRQPDGRWLQGPNQNRLMWFQVDVPAGEPSKWLTLYATRVLEWWDLHRSPGQVPLHEADDGRVVRERPRREPV